MTRTLVRALMILGLFAVMAQSAHGQRSNLTRQQRRQFDRHIKHAKAYATLGQYENSAKEFLQAYELDPKPGLYFNAAHAFWLGDQEDQALEYYGRYLEVDPGGRAAPQARERFFEAGERRWQKQEVERALDIYARYIELAPSQSPNVSIAKERFFEAAEGLWNQGHKPASLAHYRRYLDLAPTGPSVAAAKGRWFDWAEEFWAQGKRDKAVEEYGRYLEFEPEGEIADRAKARMAERAEELERARADQELEEAAAEAARLEEARARAAEEYARLATRESPSDASSWGVSGLLHVAFDYQARGAAVQAGAGVGTPTDWGGLEVRAAGLLGPTLGAYMGGAARIRLSRVVDATAGVGVPVFFSEGMRLGVRGSGGLEWAALGHVAVVVELGVEHLFNPEWNRERTVLVPILGLRAH